MIQSKKCAKKRKCHSDDLEQSRLLGLSLALAPGLERSKYPPVRGGLAPPTLMLGINHAGLTANQTVLNLAVQSASKQSPKKLVQSGKIK